ncbi:Inositol 2-dehydrogenase [Vibrio thalassae]|uniref:Inositol 2-dehydrogenase n=1 Tax=Vibrio thalassae TaxID=1243014 RepID=A0A240ENB5_9VIBR|nr:inositol 2-dehydrogenase [Vibrio thalassae]SNX49495.1 Inositol 2-dehydrogenase [Vibrio thalassae]
MINIALFGSGRIGRIHASNINAHPLCRLVHVVDPHKPSAQELADSFDASVVETEYALKSEEIDAVFICSPTDTHATLIELAARHQKAIFCEKPIDLSSQKVRECLAVVKQENALFMIGFNRRFDPNFAKLKQAVSENKIGNPESLVIISRDPQAPPSEYIRASGGMFKDMTIHDFDMARFLFDQDVLAVSASGRCLVDKRIEQEGDIDTAMVTLEFACGGLATIINSRRSGYGYDQRIEFHGSKGLIKAENVKSSLLQVWSAEGCMAEKPLDFFLERYKEAYQMELQYFVDVFNGGVPNTCDGDAGLKAMLLAEASLLSFKTGQRIELSKS